jgi:hypothetical protein
MTVTTRAIVWTAIVAALAAVLFATLPDVDRTKPRPRPPHTEEPLPLIGEQNLLTQQPGGAPVTLGGVPMYNACALLPESQVTAAGLRVHRYVRAGSDHLSRDSNDPALLAGEGTDTSGCSYHLEPPGGITEAKRKGDLSGYSAGWVSVAVEQAPFSGAGQYGLLRERTERYAEAGIEPARAGGVSWYRSTTPTVDTRDLTFYLFRPEATDTLVTLIVEDFPETYAGKPRDRVGEELVAVVAANLEAGPKGPVRHEFAAPYRDLRHACEVFTPDLFEDHVGEPDSGFVSEDYSRGERSFSELGGVVLGLHVDSSCTRVTSAKANRSSTGVGITVTFEYYRDRPQAERSLVSLCRATDAKPGAVVVEHRIGAATCLFMDDELVFNTGRYNVWIEVDSARPITSAVLAERLIPLADKIADRLR